MKIAFVMDPMDGVKPHKDTTFFLMLAARERGHQTYHVNPSKIRLHGSEVLAEFSEVEVWDRANNFYRAQPSVVMAFDQMDAVMIRTDPPFDRRYTYVCMMLDLVPGPTQVFNRPSSLLAWNEKLAAFRYPQFTPTSVVTSDVRELREFMSRVGGKMVVKPIDGHGGRGIFVLEEGDRNLDQILSVSTSSGSRWVVAQAYVQDAHLGDKRILLLQGEPIGAILRVHAEGKELNNLDAGGSAHQTELNEADRAICAAMKDDLVKAGLLFVGIDVIGGKLIEVNVTSPTGLREASRFSGLALHQDVIKAMERRCAS